MAVISIEIVLRLREMLCHRFALWPCAMHAQCKLPVFVALSLQHAARRDDNGGPDLVTLCLSPLQPCCPLGMHKNNCAPVLSPPCGCLCKDGSYSRLHSCRGAVAAQVEVVCVSG